MWLKKSELDLSVIYSGLQHQIYIQVDIYLVECHRIGAKLVVHMKRRPIHLRKGMETTPNWAIQLSESDKTSGTASPRAKGVVKF